MNCESRQSNLVFVLTSIFSFLKTQFKNADVNNSKYLTIEEVKGLCKSLNIKISKEELQDAFDLANTKKDGSLKEFGQDVLNEDEFVDFYYHLMRRPEIDELFDKYAKEDEVNKFFLNNCFHNLIQFRTRNDYPSHPSRTS